MSEARTALRVGYVPEHFSAPLHFAKFIHNAPITLRPFPSGTGHMITALADGEIDIGIGLTEGWVAGLAKHQQSEHAIAPYSLVGTYVESPLCWAVSTGSKRTDIAKQTDPGEWLKDLHGRKLGVSRIGSGSYVMGFVLADKFGWISGQDAASTETREPFKVVPLDTFEKLRNGVQQDGGTADFFMWEHFTSKKYFDNGEIKKIGEIYTPWPSWHIVARTGLENDARLEELFLSVSKGVAYFNANNEEAVKYIYTELDYSEQDARDWLKTVQFATDVRGVRPKVVDETLSVLRKAHVVAENQTADGMITIDRKEKGLLDILTGN